MKNVLNSKFLETLKTPKYNLIIHNFSLFDLKIFFKSKNRNVIAKSIISKLIAVE